MKKLFICILALTITATQALAQPAHSFLRKADKSYQKEDYNGAEENYRKSLEEEYTEQGKYNLGNAIYEQDRYEEAMQHFEEVTESAADNGVKANAFHNLGNAHFLNQEYDKSVEAYKNSLRLDPKDMDTKKNLSMALQQMRLQQQQQQQQDQNENEDQDQEQQDQQQQEQQQEQEDQEQQDQQEQEQDQNQDQKQEQESEEMEEKDLNKEEAKRLLEIMEEEEKKVQEKMRKAAGKKTKSDR